MTHSQLGAGDEMSSLRIEAVLAEGVSSVLDSMRLHLDNPQLQYMGCWSLVNMALEPTHKTALLSAGVIDVISDAMDRHVDEPKVQFRALFALINLVTVSGVIQAKSAEGLIRRVMVATGRYITYPDVAGRGCMVLYNMSLDRGNHVLLKAIKAPALICRAAELHSEDHLLKFVATSTACRLA
uniref:Armadillo repeat-containing protein 8 n=1 Tax=Rhizochromulina marina TaxID=1034831 RepID=A0A6U1ADD5_9STRA|mmetsp:Transcript_2494/g.7318  ORF Transcript_2494/g.7318 Transcript_2494/m.7318 type:complete len:183 (+) Transcript_2494:211-759(+)